MAILHAIGYKVKKNRSECSCKIGRGFVKCRFRFCRKRTWRGVGVAYRAGFENQCALLEYRGFESRPLRSFLQCVIVFTPASFRLKVPRDAFFID